ncbi:recombinase family protein [Adhaeribacter rhizoryzae]|uniref:Recombinase family protein n=1 Tax=Adhaeribacter rhizoryzae TaxID=2607907 RepID=A0A5M6CV02_9BACT|nr:recombinase family protein [Adhaeribacter rhizoryzae]KAA5539044.1 recombinase family protein [Adhaeribacter rhizoryzae]
MVCKITQNDYFYPKMEKKYIAYYWASTPLQAKSDFGLKAQQEMVKTFIKGKGELVAEYTGVGGGLSNGRPELDAAIAHAQVTGSTLIVDRLNRLCRDPAFIANLRQSGLVILAVQLDLFDTFFTA